MLGVQQCPTCGHPVPTGARFCGDCGQPFSQASGPGGESRFRQALQASPGEPRRVLSHPGGVSAARAQQPTSGAARVLRTVLMTGLALAIIGGAGVAGFFLVLQVASAGAHRLGATTTPSHSGTPTAIPFSPTATPTPSSAPPTLALNGQATADIDGVHIQTKGIHRNGGR
jgi:hypothetical protein